jgi:GDPmannose 4,6-dehydratase
VCGVGGPDDARLPEGVRPARGTLGRADGLLDDNGPLDALVHLGGQSSVSVSWQDPFDSNARLSATLAFAAARRKLRFVQASSAEIFGNAGSSIQDESTPIAPLSPYARDEGGSALHDPPREGGLRRPRLEPHLLPRRVAPQASDVRLPQDHAHRGGDRDGRSAGACPRQYVGRPRLLPRARPRGRREARRPRGHAGRPRLRVGEGHSVLDVATTACAIAGVDARVIRTDPALLRPNEVLSLVGDSRRLRSLGWRPPSDSRPSFARFSNMISRPFARSAPAEAASSTDGAGRKRSGPLR